MRTRVRLARLLGGKPNIMQPKSLRHRWYWFIKGFSLECLLFQHLLDINSDYPTCLICDAGGPDLKFRPWASQGKYDEEAREELA